MIPAAPVRDGKPLTNDEVIGMIFFPWVGGPHRCFGSNLARAERRIALEEWLGVIPEFSIKPGSQLRSHDGGRS